MNSQNQKSQNKNLSKQVREQIQVYLEKGKGGKPFTKDGQEFRKKILVDFFTNGGLESTQTSVIPTEKRLEPLEIVNGVPITPIDYREYMLDDCPEYFPFNAEEIVFESHLNAEIPILVSGPKGIGKTLAIASYAKKKKIPILQTDCSENTKRTDLIGRFRLQGEQVVFDLGFLPRAIEVANQCGTAILVLEELNALTPQIQKILNQLLDWRRHIHIPEIGKIYKLAEGAKLLICATQNPSYYGGVHELNEDLLSRFTVWRWDYPNTVQEKKIIATADVPKENVDHLLMLSKELRAAVADNTLEYALSPRDEVKFLRIYKEFQTSGMTEPEALEKALTVAVLGLYEVDKHVEAVKARISSTFAVDLGSKV